MIHSLNSADYVEYIAYLKEEGVLNYDRTTKNWGNLPIEWPLLGCLYDIYKEGFTFVDLGCGAGNVLRYAQNAGYEVAGVEYDKTLFKYLEPYNYFSNNIEDLSPEFYKDYDVIYSYCPLKDGQRDYINSIIEHMKPGAYLVLPFYMSRNKRVENIERYVYQKKGG